MKKRIIFSLLFLILVITFVSAYTVISNFEEDKEIYIKDKANELKITEKEYIEKLVEESYLADNPELPIVSESELLIDEAISLIYSMGDDEVKLNKAVTELNKIKSNSIIGEIKK